MMLNRVTMTGADDSVYPRRLAEITDEFPFVEWGILLSSSQQGGTRFPSMDWLNALHETFANNRFMQLSFHICGRWVRDICEGDWRPFLTSVGDIIGIGKRVQLNFHAYEHLLGETFVAAARDVAKNQNWQIIFQCDGVNDHLVSNAFDDGLDAVPLFDKSGGAGVTPDLWPRAMKGIYSGYAGGLGPDNLDSEINSIWLAAQTSDFWIDMESKLFSNGQFDLGIVRRCLKIAAPHVLTKPYDDDAQPITGEWLESIGAVHDPAGEWELAGNPVVYFQYRCSRWFAVVGSEAKQIFKDLSFRGDVRKMMNAIGRDEDGSEREKP